MRVTSGRFPLAWLMALVGIIAIGLAAMRNASWLAVQIAFTLTLLALMVGLLAALVRRGDGAWAGFAVFGWCYAICGLIPAVGDRCGQRLLTNSVLLLVVDQIHPTSIAPSPPRLNTRFVVSIGDLSLLPDLSASQIDRSLLTTREETMVDGYVDQIRAYRGRYIVASHKQNMATEVGKSLLTVLFALGGALLGRALEIPHRPGEIT